MNPIQGYTLPVQTGLAATHDEAKGNLPGHKGELGGQKVTVKDVASVLADAAEELSLDKGEKAEDKQFGDLKWKPEASGILVHQIADITAYLDAAAELDSAEELVALAKRMQSGQGNPRELARQQSRDPTTQYMLLEYALRDGEASGTPGDVLEDLRDAMAELEVASGAQIRAGLNTVGVAAAQGGTAQDIAAFQGTYRDVALGDHSLSQTMSIVLERLGGPQGEEVTRGLQGLIRALGADLSATRPSTDPARLQVLVADLYQLEVVSTVLDGCRELAAALDSRHGSSGLRPVDLMKELVSVTGEKWVSAQRFNSLAEKFGATAVPAQIAFQRGVKGMLSELPVQVFSDTDARAAVLNAAQAALDEAVDKEEG